MRKIIEDKDRVIEIWQDWITKQSADKFIFNPDKQVVSDAAEGVLIQQKKKGLKYCPCKIVTGDKEKDFPIICPCNFKQQDTWKQKGECWCLLFVKEK